MINFEQILSLFKLSLEEVIKNEENEEYFDIEKLTNEEVNKYSKNIEDEMEAYRFDEKIKRLSESKLFDPELSLKELVSKKK